MGLSEVLFCFVSFLALINMSGAGGAQFLGIQRRFRDSSYYDSYYCCNSCGGDLLWEFDGTGIFLHSISQSNVGDVEVHAVNSSSRFSSMILSHRGNGSEACIDAVIMATQTNPEWRPRVICRSRHQQHIVEYNNSLIDPIYEDHNSNVAVTYSIMQPNIVPARTDPFITHFLVCRSIDNHITWTFNGSSVVFNGKSKPGSKGLKLYPEDPTTALYEAIVLDKTSNEITSVFVGTILEPRHLYLRGNISCSSSLDQTLSFPMNIFSSIEGNNGTNVTEEGNNGTNVTEEGNNGTNVTEEGNNGTNVTEDPSLAPCHCVSASPSLLSCLYLDGVILIAVIVWTNLL